MGIAEEEEVRDEEVEGLSECGELERELPLGIAAVAVEDDEVGLVELAVGGGPKVHGCLVVQIDGAGGEIAKAEIVGQD